MKRIQKLDYDRYFSLILSPKERIEELSVLINYNIELAQIKNKITEPTMGFIRLQWWREAIEEIYDSKPPRKHDVVLPLSEIIKKYSLEKKLFDQTIDAREADLKDDPFETTEDLLSYLSNTAGALNLISAQTLYCEEIFDDGVLKAIDCFSVAWGITAILKSANNNLAKGRNIFPKDLIEEFDIEVQNYGSPNFPEKIKPAIEKLLYIAKEKIVEGRDCLEKSDRAGVKSKIASVLIYGKIAEYRIKQIRRCKYDVLKGRISRYLPFSKMLWLLLSVKMLKF